MKKKSNPIIKLPRNTDFNLEINNEEVLKTILDKDNNRMYHGVNPKYENFMYILKNCELSEYKNAFEFLNNNFTEEICIPKDFYISLSDKLQNEFYKHELLDSYFDFYKKILKNNTDSINYKSCNPDVKYIKIYKEYWCLKKIIDIYTNQLIVDKNKMILDIGINILYNNKIYNYDKETKNYYRMYKKYIIYDIILFIEISNKYDIYYYNSNYLALYKDKFKNIISANEWNNLEFPFYKTLYKRESLFFTKNYLLKLHKVDLK